MHHFTEYLHVCVRSLDPRIPKNGEKLDVSKIMFFFVLRNPEKNLSNIIIICVDDHLLSLMHTRMLSCFFGTCVTVG